MGCIQGTTLYRKRRSSHPEAARGAALCVLIYTLYCKYCATRGVCIGDAHGPGRSQGNIGMRGAKKCGRLCCLSPPEVKLSSQVLQLTQTLRQTQPLLIAMCLHVAPCVVHSRPWRSCLGWRLRVYCLGKQTCEEELLHRDPLSWLRWCVGSRTCWLRINIAAPSRAI
jgi:hypothetical protein